MFIFLRWAWGGGKQAVQSLGRLRVKAESTESSFPKTLNAFRLEDFQEHNYQ